MAGTVAKTSRDSEVTIGVIMKARMMPQVKNEAPLTGWPNRASSTGIPYRPQTTDGTTASRSTTYTIGRAQRRGTTSVSSRAMATLIGTDRMIAIAAVMIVP